MEGNWLTYGIPILIQMIYAGMFLFTKAAFNSGMDTFVFTFYRQAVASIFLVPIVIACERKAIPPMNLCLLLKIFTLALLGICLSLNIHGIALHHTSSTLAAAITNTLPAITFFLALLFRKEDVNLKSFDGIGKVGGIILSLGGAFAIALYEGPHLIQGYNPVNHHPTVVVVPHLHSNINWIKGCFLMLASTILWGLWLVLQGPLLKAYPSKLSFTAVVSLLSAAQSFVLALVFQRDIYQWKLGFDVRLLAVAYSGVVVTGTSFYMQTWCVEKKGPVFLAIFTPLSLVITTICSTFLLGESIYLGSLLGGVLMVGGLYCVLWGKSKEQSVTVDDQKSIPIKNERLEDMGRDAHP